MSNVNTIMSATNLDNLLSAIIEAGPEGMEEVDHTDLPVFGGERPRPDVVDGWPVMSWDADRLLVQDDSIQGWQILPRE